LLDFTTASRMTGQDKDLSSGEPLENYSEIDLRETLESMGVAEDRILLLNREIREGRATTGQRRRPFKGSRIDYGTKFRPNSNGYCRSGDAVVAEHDFVTAIFFVADVFAAFPVLRRNLFERGGLHLYALL
jgi:hypothetical protein